MSSRAGIRAYAISPEDGSVVFVSSSADLRRLAGGDTNSVPLLAVAEGEPPPSADEIMREGASVLPSDTQGRSGRSKMREQPPSEEELTRFRSPSATFDPRPVGDNSWAEDTPVFGVEVTRGDLAGLCDAGNLDPQHGFGTVDAGDAETAVMAATDVPLPPEDATLVTVRADADAVGAMAVLGLRRAGYDVAADPDAMERVLLVDAADKAGGDDSHVASMPFPEDGVARIDIDEMVGPVAPIAAIVSDFRRPMDERVAAMQEWVVPGSGSGELPADLEEVRARLVSEAQAALDETRVAPSPVEGLARVESTHRNGISIGYRFAPVVVAENPEFRFRGGDPHRKVTIAKFDDSRPGDFQAAANLLNREEQVARGNDFTLAGDGDPIADDDTIDALEGRIDALGGARTSSRKLPGWGPTDADQTVVRVFDQRGGEQFFTVPGDSRDSVVAAAKDLGATAEVRYNDTATWGGSKTLVGSPQGESTQVPSETIDDIMASAGAGRTPASAYREATEEERRNVVEVDAFIGWTDSIAEEAMRSSIRRVVEEDEEGTPPEVRAALADRGTPTAQDLAHQADQQKVPPEVLAELANRRSPQERLQAKASGAEDPQMTEEQLADARSLLMELENSASRSAQEEREEYLSNARSEVRRRMLRSGFRPSVGPSAVEVGLDDDLQLGSWYLPGESDPEKVLSALPQVPVMDVIVRRGGQTTHIDM